ncbi:bacterioferritin-associated ferredoxin [Duganella sp. CF402]|uniref:(2Fe-2S)-binding protein n=1 Tax=unclassified Duganella TaxID=2636909 RepID=UPI0008B4579D|nr:MULTISPECIES: (2Fe-2S)-binding protein [unclassified Duganella]RZT08060.1 bacterioferritin-associated ferredoxin [Duganella sp. BK701]SEM07055.1 bacterioferritin-associated ferredoxin [Duganella sp. CF402]
MIVCVCNNISDREIRQAMDLGITSMEELRDALGVATCCGQCFSCAEDILTEQLAAQAAATEIKETVLKRPAFAN